MKHYEQSAYHDILNKTYPPIIDEKLTLRGEIAAKVDDAIEIILRLEAVFGARQK